MALKKPIKAYQETEDEIIVAFKFPGVKEKDIRWNVTETTFEISVEKEEKKAVKDRDFEEEEHIYQGFYKEMFLPCEIQPKKTKTNFEEDIFQVIMRKA
jgi:HSP20 family molecular chaperone IbpA